MITYEKMTELHIDGIMEVEHNCFAFPWHRKSFEKELTNKIAHYTVALNDEKVIAYAGIWKIWDEVHITNIAVHSNFRNMGVGAELLKQIIVETEKDGIGYITLEVKKSNITAQKLYEKFGFEICGERKKYYADGEDAFIMSRVT